jgi:hypothetical protein
MGIFIILYICLVIVLITYFVSFRYLLKIVGEHGGYEINSIGGIFLFAINPLNFFRLYKIFFMLKNGDYDFDGNTYKRNLIANIASYIFFIILAILLSNYNEAS